MRLSSLSLCDTETADSARKNVGQIKKARQSKVKAMLIVFFNI